MFKRIFFLMGMLVLVACSQGVKATTPTPSNIPTRTPYSPVSEHTPFPAIHKVIDSNNVKDVSLIALWNRGSGFASDIVFSANGKYLLNGANNQIFFGWDTTNGNVIAASVLNIAQDSNFFSPVLSYSTDKEYLAQISSGGLKVSRPNFKDADLYYYFYDAIGVAFVPNTKFIAIAISDGTVLFTPFATLSEKLSSVEEGYTSFSSSFPSALKLVLEEPFQMMAFSSDGSQMILFYESGKIELWDVPTLSLRLEFHNPDLSRSRAIPIQFAFNADNQILAIADTNEVIRFWDVISGELIHNIQSHQENIDGLAFSPDGRLFASLEHETGAAVWGLLPSIDSFEALATVTALAEESSNTTPSPLQLPNPTLTPTSPIIDTSSSYPMSWPLEAFTLEQLSDAKNCDIEETASQRYPQTLEFSNMYLTYLPESACDWASLAYAYLTFFENKETVPGEAQLAYYQAISINPAYILKLPLFYGFFNSTGPLVKAPDFSSQEIRDIKITYDWGGIGEPSHVEYQINIRNIDSFSEEMVFSVTGQPLEYIENLNADADPRLIQKIDFSLNNLLPIDAQFELEVCTDNRSNWEVELVYVDGTTLTLNTNNSNFLSAGAPWQMEFNGQNYLHYSPDFLIAILDLMDALQLPIGQPYGSFCAPIDPLPLAYPSP